MDGSNKMLTEDGWNKVYYNSEEVRNTERRFYSDNKIKRIGGFK